MFLFIVMGKFLPYPNMLDCSQVIKLVSQILSCHLFMKMINLMWIIEIVSSFCAEGVPLPAIGALAYGTVAMLSAFAISKTSKDTFTHDVVRWVLLGSTGSMASASIYFMYILSTKLEGASCAYCVGSAMLSVILLLLT